MGVSSVRRPVQTAFEFVTEHNLLVLVLMLAVTAGVTAGMSQLQTESEMNGSDAIGDTEVAQKYEYIQNSYGDQNESDGNGTATRPAAVYVRADDEGEDGNALSKAALLDSLRYQQAVRENDSVAASLGGREALGVANLVARQAAGDPDATLDEQVAALESASESDVERLVAATLTEEVRAELGPADTLVCLSDHGLQDGDHTHTAFVGATDERAVEGVESVLDVREGLDRVTPSRRHVEDVPVREAFQFEGRTRSRAADEVRGQLEDLGYL